MRAVRKRSLGFFILLLAALCTLMIWSFSMEGGSTSESRSRIVVAILGRLLPIVSPARAELIVRKAAHFLEYALLGALFTLALYCFGLPLRRYFTHVLFPCLLAAVLDETIQIYSPGRASSTIDVLIDLAGAVAGAVFVASVAALLSWRKHRRR